MCNGGVSDLLAPVQIKMEKCKKKSHYSIMVNVNLNKKILPKEKYQLFSKYFYYILCTNYQWISILYLLDFEKVITF